MTEQQKNRVEPILNTFVNDDIRAFAELIVADLPEYIWQVGASSTGKYHPAYSLGEGGLMSHQIAVVRFLNFFFELEQYNSKLTSREMDLMRLAGLVHDGRKSGEQDDYEKSKFTKFDHPIQMANVVRSYDGKYLNHDEIEFIANCISSHMGSWNTDKKSNAILPKPTNIYQEMIHLADYLASRKDLTMAFDASEQSKTATANLDYKTYVLDFGKHKGTKLIDLYKEERDYCMWLKENSYKREIVDMIKQIEAQEEDEI